MPGPLIAPGMDVPAPRPRVLVVDDDPAFAAVAREFLALDGYEVHVCTDSAQALARAGALQPALLLLDVRMPGVNGLALLGRLRLGPRTGPGVAHPARRLQQGAHAPAQRAAVDRCGPVRERGGQLAPVVDLQAHGAPPPGTTQDRGQRMPRAARPSARRAVSAPRA